MADLFTLDNWIPTNPTEEDFKSQFAEVWNYPSKKDRLKEYHRQYDKKWHANNRESCLVRLRRWRSENPERNREIQKNSRDKNRESINAKHRAVYDKNRPKILKKNNFVNLALKMLVIDWYSHGLNECLCCGITGIHNLTIDHISPIHGNRSDGCSSRQLYRNLINNDFPEGYQVLCNGCNQSKGTSDKCKIDHSHTGSGALFREHCRTNA